MAGLLKSGQLSLDDLMGGPSPSKSDKIGLDDLFGEAVSDKQARQDFAPASERLGAPSRIEEIGAIERARDEAGPSMQRAMDRRQKARLADNAAMDRANEAAQLAATDDTATVLRKTIENLPQRMKRSAAGMVRALVESSTAAPDGFALTPQERADFEAEQRAIVEEGAKRGDIPGQQAALEAGRALQANAPRFRTYGQQIGAGVVNALFDLGTAAGVSLITRSPTLGASTTGAIVFGDRYAESREKGRSAAESLGDATFYAAAEFLPERLALGQIMKPGGKFLGRVAKGAAAEGAQEMVTEVLQAGYDAGVLDEKMTWGEAVARVRDAGIIGGIAGGTITGGVAGIDAARERRAARPAPAAAPAPEAAFGAAIEEAAKPTPDDIASPLPTEAIVEGKRTVATNQARNLLDEAARAAGAPELGSALEIIGPDGRAFDGTLDELFDSPDPELPGQGFGITLSDGTRLREMGDDLRDAGYEVRQPRAPFDMGQTDRTMSRDLLKKRIGTAESGGNDSAKNPNSSASGRYQFIDSTFLGLYRAEFGNTGESDAAILAKKNDTKLQERLMDRLIEQNEAALARAGFEPTPGNLYLAHLLGSGGAVSVLRARPNASAEAIVGAGVVKANPFMRGMTASDLAAWAAGRVGGAANASGEQAAFEDGTPADTGPDFLSEPLDAQDDSEQVSGIGGATPADAPGVSSLPPQRNSGGGATTLSGAAPALAEPTITDTESGKGIIVKGISDSQLALIRERLPKVSVSQTRDGGYSFSKKNEDQIRAILVETRAGAAESGGARVAPVESSAPATRPQPTVLDREAVRSLGRDQGSDAVDVRRAGEALREAADAALARGDKVTLFADGKAIDITQPGLKDAKGQSWGVMAILTDAGNNNNRLEIASSAQQQDSTSTPEAVEVKTKRRGPSMGKGPVDMARFIAANGGIRDDEGHSLRKGRGLETLFVPGAGKVIRANGGRSVDEMGELLHEAGYFGPPATTPRPTEAQVLEKLDELTRRKIYRPDEEQDVADAEEAARQDAATEAKRQEILEAFEGYFEPNPSEAEIAAVFDIIGRFGLPAPEAVEYYYSYEAAAVAEEAGAQTNDPFYDVPGFDDGATNAEDQPSGEAEAGVADGSRGAGQATEPRAESAGEEAGQADGEGGQGQVDAFGERDGDRRRALEAQGDGRMRARAPQRAPGSDGGLFDQRGSTQDLFDTGAKSAPSSSNEDETRPARDTGIQYLEGDQEALLQPQGGRVSEIRRGRDNDAPGLGEQLSGISGGDRASPITETQRGSDRRDEGLRAGQRQVGDDAGTGGESDRAEQSSANGQRQDADGIGVVAGNRDRNNDNNPQAEPGVGSGQGGADPGAIEVGGARPPRSASPTPEAQPERTEEEKSLEAFQDMRGEMSQNMRDGLARIDADPVRQRDALRRAEAGPIPDGDLLYMHSPRWLLENGYVDVTFDRGLRHGELNDKGRAKIAELDGKASPAASPSEAPARPAGYGSKNKLVSADRAAEVRKRLQDKLRNQLNSGIDPEIVALGIELGVFHIEAGARKFADWAKAVADDMGMSLGQLRPFLRGWYNGARDTMEDAGEDVSDMDGPGAVKAAIAMIEDAPATAPAPAPAPTPAPRPAAAPRKASAKDGVKLRDWSNTIIPNPDDRQRGESDGGETKDAFLKDGRTYLKAVESILAERGFKPGVDRRGKPMKAVRVNEAGPAVSGDVLLTMFTEQGGGVYVQIGTALAGPNGGISLMTRWNTKANPYGGAGQNNWWPVNLTAGELADRLVSLANEANERMMRSEARNGDQGSLRPSDAPAGASDVQRAAQDGGARPAPRPEGGRSEQDVREPVGERTEAAERAGARSGQAQGNRGAGALDVDRVPAPDANARSGRRADSADAVAAGNWIIEPGSLDESRGAMQKARDNLRAIEIVKELDASGRLATREQQAALAKYVGWGGLKNAFAADAKGFETIAPRLKELLTEEEYETARRSTQYAHYTSEKVIRPMWEAAQRFGFTGGTVFEPGMGTGNFLGMMPPELAAASRYEGLEFDGITARIAQLLYPKSGVRLADYTRTPAVKDAFDLVIGNPPFSETVIRSDPAYAKEGFVMHDFFFAKSLDAVRPGGLLMFVTSAGTMNKVGTKAREYLADRADLVGAVRLPGDAFAENAGTQVTTDIIVLRKRLPGEQPGDRSWVETGNIELPNRSGGRVQGAVNRYFIANPEQVLGEQGMFDQLVAGERYAVRARPGADLTDELEQAFERLPANVMQPWSAEEARWDAIFGGERKDGEFFMQDGRLFQHRAGVGRPVESRGKGVTGGMSAKDQERVAALVPIKDALRDVLKADLRGDTKTAETARAALNRAYDTFIQRFGPINKAEISYRRPTVIQQESARAEAREAIRLQGGFFDEGSFNPSDMIAAGARLSEIAAARREAREAAQALGREWDEGSFNPEDMPDIVIVKRPNVDAFMDDPESYRLRAIEHFNDDTGEAKKGNIFFENIITREREPTINSAGDALLYVLNKVGRPDIAMIADAAGMSESQVLEELEGRVFRVPREDGVYQTREQYLSGNVREKLEIAREAAQFDPEFERNVRALEAVQPALLGPSDIAVNLGMPWIPSAVIEDFGKSALGLNSLTARYRPRLAQWNVDGDRSSAASTSVWGTSDMDAVLILGAVLNRTQIVVKQTIKTPDGERTIVNEEATAAAQDKARQMKERFSAWVWEDQARGDALVALYNRDYNNLVAPQYDGSYLTTPGIASHWKWRPHQTRVIARIIQAGNTYMAHGVGAGKTSAMIGAGMEMRRLGLVNKPMYVVPNHMLGQFTKEFYEQYPTAKIMVADERQFHTDRRKQFVANAGATDLDAIIITHSAFGFIPLSDEFSDQLIQEQIDDFREILDEAKAETRAGNGRGDRFTVRRIEQSIEALQQRLSGKAGGKKKDQVFTFEEMGVDFLFVDEAHLFRKLDFATKMGNVRGIDPSGSAMSYDLFSKTRYLESRRPGRSHVLASGTPVTNTMAELFTVSRYLQPQELAARQLGQFDAWAGAFGDTVTALEQDPAGGYKPQTRFARFMNVPELSAMVRQIMDVVTSKQLEQYVVRPKLKGGKRRMVVAQQTPELEDYQADLAARMEAIQNRQGPPQKGDDILLSVIGDGRKAAIDMRLVRATAPRREGSKLELMIDNVARIAEETKNQPFYRAGKDGYEAKPYRRGRATQMIFSDLGINGEFQVHKYIKAELIRRGLKPSEVAIISEYKSHVARQRLFNDMNEGKVRVLIGSVPKMGTGVNAQRQLYAIHNLDPQWYPANDEQRNGRGIRQGNENPEIEIIDYSTKGTYDSTMWGLMETKARFIEGFFNGDPTMRSMDDLGEASQYEQAKAITTADPRILELTGYRQDLERALLRKAAFDREQYAIRSRINDARGAIERANQRIPEIEADIAARQDITGDNFKATVGGVEFTDRGDFGQAVLDRLDILAKGEGRRDAPVGEVGGFALTADALRFGRDTTVKLYINFTGGNQREIGFEKAGGIASSIASALRRFEDQLAFARQVIVDNEKVIADFTPELGKQFTGQAEIDELQGKVDELEGQLIREAEMRDAARRERAAPPQPPKEDALTNKLGSRYGQAVDVEAAKAELKAALRKVDPLGRIRLETVEKAFPGKKYESTRGLYWPGARLIEVVINHQKGGNEYWTLHHEVVHAFRDMGLWTEAEWTALAEQARSRKDIADRIKATPSYRALSEEEQTEEMVAELFGEFASQEDETNNGALWKRALIKSVLFLRGMARVIRGKSWTPLVEQIMRRALSGEIGQRTPTRAVFGRKPIEGDARPMESAAAPAGIATPPSTITEAIERAKGLVGTLGQALDDWRTAMQDKMLPLLRAQAAAERVLGRALAWHENPYMGEELMSGRVGAQLEMLTDEMVAPLFDTMKRLKINAAELESYLYARHAPERNEAIDKINPEADGRGSGMSNVEAAAIMARIEDEGRTKDFEEAAAAVDRITAWTRDLLADSGLLSEEQLRAWEQYQHYVPLRGFEGVETDEAPRTGGSGINIRGKEAQRAFGRRSKAADILAYTIMQAEQAIVRSQKNEVARKLYNLAKAAPDEDFWKISPVTRKRRLNPETGLVEYVLDRNLQPQDEPFTVSLKVDGKEKRVTFNRENPAAVRVAAAMRGMNEVQRSMFIRFLSTVNGYFSKINTTLSPEFVITNAFRDAQTAAFNIQDSQVKGITRATMKHYPKALVAATKGAFKRRGGEWGQWYQDFIDDGGKISFNRIEDLGTLRARIEREVNHLNRRELSPGSIALHARHAITSTLGFIENVNSGVENAVRLAAYRAAREAGIGREAAASLAKNLTVNFNRHGSAGPTVNAFYLFFNASVQGSARILMALGRSRRVQALAISAMALGFGLDMLNRALTGDDDDDEDFYGKVPDFDKSRNLIVMIPGSETGGYIKIPLPYGYNFFYAAGRGMSAMLAGENKWKELGLIAETLVDAFNPIGGTNNLLNLIAPTIVDPVVDLARNRDFADRPIMPDERQFGPQTPDNQRYWGSVSPYSRAVTDFLNEASGGDKVRPGAIDMSPETLDYLFGTATGSAGRFVGGLANVPAKLLDPEAEFTRNDIPMARKVLGTKPVWYDKAMFYERLGQVEQAVADGKQYKALGDDGAFEDFKAEKIEVLSMRDAAKTARKGMRLVKKEQKRIDQALERGTMDKAAHRARSERIKAVQDKVIVGFNRAWNARVGEPE